MPKKLDRCVKSVAAKGKVKNPHAVCNASLKKARARGKKGK